MISNLDKVTAVADGLIQEISQNNNGHDRVIDRLFALLVKYHRPDILYAALPVVARVTQNDRLHARKLDQLLGQTLKGNRISALTAAIDAALARSTLPCGLLTVLLRWLSIDDDCLAYGAATRILMREDAEPQIISDAAWLLRSSPKGDKLFATAAMERAIIANPMDQTLLRAWFDDRFDESGLIHALDNLERLSQHANATPHLARMLLRWRRYKERILVLSRGDAEDCDTVWSDHLYGRPGNVEQCARVAGLPLTVLRSAMLRYATRVVPLGSDHPYHVQTLKKADINLEQLRDWAAGFLQIGSSAWRDVIDSAGSASSPKIRRISRQEAYTGWQDRTVAEGRLVIPCPVSGKPCEAFDSVYVQGITYYAFAGVETFYLRCHGYSMRAESIWCPARKIMISLDRENETGEGAILKGALSILLQRLAINYGRFINGRAITSANRRAIVLVRYNDNFAHQIWNIYSGLERLAVAGLLSRISELHYYELGFFGDLKDIYPDVPGSALNPQKKLISLFDPEPFSTDSIVVPIGGYFMGRGLRRRIRDSMALRPPRAPSSPDPSKGSHPIIWVGIRVTDKGWVDQESGIADFCQKIISVHSSASFVFDGFTLPLGTETVDPRWSQALGRLNQIVEGIKLRLGQPGRVFSLVGETIREAVLWADQIDAYVTPLGTSQHKVGWFSDAPGVIYSHPSYLQHPEIAPGSWEAEGASMPVHVAGVPDREAGDNVLVRLPRPKMENLHVCASEIAENVLSKLGRPN